MFKTKPKVHSVPEKDYVALPYNSMERPVLNGEDSVPLKFTISWVSLIQILNLLRYFQNQHFFQPSTDCRARREEPDPDNKHLVGDLDWVGFLFFFFLVLLILFFLSDDLAMFIYISQPFNTSQVNHVMVRPLHALEWIRAQQYQCKALSWHRINSLQDIKQYSVVPWLTTGFLLH